MDPTQRDQMQTLDPMSEYIVEAAARRGIDPAAALRVAKSEGLNEYTGDGGSSFGPFQLHYGGVASGGNRVAGLGDDFTKATGLDARDPNTWKAQVDFALDHAAKHGWGAFHGAANMGFDDFAGIGGNSAGGRYGALSSIAGGSDPTSAMVTQGMSPVSSAGGQGVGAAAPQSMSQVSTAGAPSPSPMGGPSANGVGSTGASLDKNAQAIVDAIKQARQPRPGLLGQLLFGNGGFSGMLGQNMPNGLLGALTGLKSMGPQQGGAPGAQQGGPFGNGLIGGAANGLSSFLQPSPMQAPNGGPQQPMGGGGMMAQAPQLGPQMSPPQPQQAQAPQQPGMPMSQPPSGQGGGQMAQLPPWLQQMFGMFGMQG
ncbi:hypothetical protein [Methylocystis parvus]|uniref:hypothetical protein n=1 Tax=Methylocystis parvus TaxID=134 RepID=UPI003C70D4BA